MIIIRSHRIVLPIAVFVSLLIMLAIASFFTATNWVFLKVNETVPFAEVTVPADPDETKCEFSNYSIRPVYYGSRFSVEKWENDGWDALSWPEGLRYDLGISMIRPFSTVERKYPTSLFAENHGAGLYRIVQDVWVGDNQNAARQVYCEFTIS